MYKHRSRARHINQDVSFPALHIDPHTLCKNQLFWLKGSKMDIKKNQYRILVRSLYLLYTLGYIKK